jgi:hypothetical protein
MLPINGASNFSELFCTDLMMLMFTVADTTQNLWFRQRLMRISRNREVTGDGRVFAGLMITYVSYSKKRTDIMFYLDLCCFRMYTRKHQRLFDLLLEAKKQYEAETETRTVVYAIDQVRS